MIGIPLEFGRSYRRTYQMRLTTTGRRNIRLLIGALGTLMAVYAFWENAGPQHPEDDHDGWELGV
jgi:hypothetical protein